MSTAKFVVVLFCLYVFGAPPVLIRDDKGARGTIGDVGDQTPVGYMPGKCCLLDSHTLAPPLPTFAKTDAMRKTTELKEGTAGHRT